MIRRILPVLGLAALAALGAACSDAKQNGATATKPSGDDKEGDDGKGGTGELSGDSNRPAAGADEVFAIWCERAGETAVVEEKLGEYYDLYCSGGKPTKLLASSLIAGAYDGQGKPSLKKIAEWEEDKAEKTTAGFIGIAIKLPITAKEHFEKVGPKGGDEASLKKLAEAGGAEGDAEVLKEYKKDGKYHVRGWKTHSTAEKEVGGAAKIKVKTDTTSRSDHYELEKGKAYMYTQYIVESAETIRTFDMLTAGVQIGDDAYLLTLAKVVTENRTFHSVAMDTIKATATDIIKFMYQSAAQVGGGGGEDEE